MGRKTCTRAVASMSPWAEDFVNSKLIVNLIFSSGAKLSDDHLRPFINSCIVRCNSA